MFDSSEIESEIVSRDVTPMDPERRAELREQLRTAVPGTVVECTAAEYDKASEIAEELRAEGRRFCGVRLEQRDAGVVAGDELPEMPVVSEEECRVFEGVRYQGNYYTLRADKDDGEYMRGDGLVVDTVPPMVEAALKGQLVLLENSESFDKNSQKKTMEPDGLLRADVRFVFPEFMQICGLKWRIPRAKFEELPDRHGITKIKTGDVKWARSARIDIDLVEEV